MENVHACMENVDVGEEGASWTCMENTDGDRAYMHSWHYGGRVKLCIEIVALTLNTSVGCLNDELRTTMVLVCFTTLLWCYNVLVCFTTPVWCYNVLVCFTTLLWCYNVLVCFTTPVWCYNVLVCFTTPVWCW